MANNLQTIFPIEANKSEKSKLITTDRSALQRYKISLTESNNDTSNHILQQIYKQHADMMDDQSEEGLDNMSGPINVLLRNKSMFRNSSKWRNGLSNFPDPISILKATDKCVCPLEIKCCNLSIDPGELKAFIDNKVQAKTRDFKPKPVLSQNQHIANEINKRDARLQPIASTSKQQFQLFQKTETVSSEGPKPKQCFQRNTFTKQGELKNTDSAVKITKNVFRSAREELVSSNPTMKRSLGTTRPIQSKFVSPLLSENTKESALEPEITDERLKHIDPKMVELIQSEIIDNSAPINWEDIAGLKLAKSVIQEAVVWPMMRPDIFTGLRRPPKGILLFGPPGTGKTLIGKCVASQCSATFFSISASSLTSKWIGDGEKMVRALFAVALCHQPAVIFIDEIDSLLTQRSDSEHEATRRIKTEFLVQFDGAATGDEDRLLIIGATNRPQELDEAARRRLVKRLYIPLPDVEARRQIVINLMKSERNYLQPKDVDEIAELADGFSGADMRCLCAEAAMGPIRSVMSQIEKIETESVRPVTVDDFKKALERVRPSVSQDDLGQYVKWNKTYGLGYMD